MARAARGEPGLVGSALAFIEQAESPLVFVLALTACLLVQVGANLVDEYSDHAGPEGSQKVMAPYKVIALGLLSASAVKRGAMASFAVATGIGLYVAAVTGWPVLAVCLASLAVAYLYAGGPRSLGTYAVGEPLVFVFMGLIMVMGTYYVHTQTVTVAALLLSIGVGCMVTAILVATNQRVMAGGAAVGDVTTVTLWGRGFGRWLWAGLVVAGIAIPVGLALTGGMGLLLLLPLLALPNAVQAQRTLWRGKDRVSLLVGLRQSARLHWRYGVLLAVGVGLAWFVLSQV